MAARRPLLCLTLVCTSLAPLATLASGLRLHLTHVDARDNCTAEERLRRATERTHRRQLASMGGVVAPVRWEGSQYIAEYRIGTPPQPAEAVVDTGSDLVWTQCASCRPRCFPQNLPLYNPTRSRTAQAVACNDTACAANSGSVTQCTRDGGTCAVLLSYGAGDALGVLGVEEFAFRSETARLAFGCVVATEIVPGSLEGASGIIGLGRGALSLVNQLGDTKFAYCLTPYLRETIGTSHLFVGPSAGLSSNGSAVTPVPFVKNPEEYPFSTFYYLPLVGMSVGDARVDVPADAFDLRQVGPGVWAGGALIDSGAPFTRLVDVAYRALRAELARQLGESLVPPPSDAALLDLCVARGDAGRLVPPLVLQFGGGGGDVVVPPENYWGPVDRDTECMVVFNAAALPNATLPMNETTVIGNYMQQDMHLLYDLGEGVLSFQKADCSSI